MQTARCLAWVCLTAALSTAAVLRAVDLDRLANPFLRTAAEKSPPAAAAPSQAWELRGVVHEGNAVYLTFFDPASKKWLNLTPGEEEDGYALEGFDETNDAATLRSNGQAMIVAMKMDGWPARSSRPTVANLASAAKSPIAPVTPATPPGLSSAEAHRLELVASEIRQQVERTKFLTARRDTPTKS